MRYTIVFVFLLMGLVSYSQLSYEQEILRHRAEINREFSDSSTTILDKNDLSNFHGLDFFPPNYDYNVAVKFKRVKKGKVVGFATSTDRIAKYRTYGFVKFTINGKKCKLTIYEPISKIKGYENHLFLPFKDLTNGDSTYGGGRYLDLDRSQTVDNLRLDFNLCYNPYCAYSGRFSCPVPPDENHLDIGINAGVRGPADH